MSSWQFWLLLFALMAANPRVVNTQPFIIINIGLWWAAVIGLVWSLSMAFHL